MKNNIKKKNATIIIAITILILIIATLVGIKILNKSSLIELTPTEIINKIDNKDSFVLCISATTCDHCAKYKPKLDKISKKHDIEIFYIDIDKYDDEEQNNLNKYISLKDGTPVTVFIKNGEEKTASNRIIGNVSSDKIVEKFIKNEFIKK